MKNALTAGLLLALTSCGSIFTGSSLQPDDTSLDFEPPQSWAAGVKFQFIDSTFVWRTSGPAPTFPFGLRVEFFDGARYRQAVGTDVYSTDGGEARTPWYRVWMQRGSEYPLMLRITVGDPQGEEVTVEYPLDVKSDDFYAVGLAVGTNRRDSPYGFVPNGSRSYPVPAGARRAATDSLLVGWTVRGRDCFNCPF